MPPRVRLRDPATLAIQREVGLRVRAARATADKTQEAAAWEAGIDVKRYQRIEAGRVNATLDTLARVARALGTTLWAMLDARAPLEDASASPRARRASASRRGRG